MKRGVTILEILFSVAIFLILLSISISHWKGLASGEALFKDRAGVVSFFEQARSLSVSSKSNTTFGINISSTTVTLFKGSVYNPADSENKYYTFNSLVQAYSVVLNGGGYNVLFSRLSGNTSQYGTIRISLINNSNSSTTITILGSGVVQ